MQHADTPCMLTACYPFCYTGHAPKNSAIIYSAIAKNGAVKNLKRET